MTQCLSLDLFPMTASRGEGRGGRKDPVNRWCRDKAREREGCGGVDHVLVATHSFTFMYFATSLILVLHPIAALVAVTGQRQKVPEQT